MTMGCCQSIHSKKRKDDAVAEYGDVVYHDVMNYLDRPDQFTTPEYKFEACSGAGIVYNVDQVAELTDESGLFYVFLDKAIKPGQRLAFVVEKTVNKQAGHSFVFGVTTCPPDKKVTHMTDRCYWRRCHGRSHQFKILRANRISVIVTFERRYDGLIYYRVGSGKVGFFRLYNKNANRATSTKRSHRNKYRFDQTEYLYPYLVLNGKVTKVSIANEPGPLETITEVSDDCKLSA